MAAEAGVSKPVLYRYFTDKDELHAAVGQWGADEVLGGLVSGPESRTSRSRERIERWPWTPTSPRWRSTRRCSCCWSGTGAQDPLADGKARIAGALARMLADTLARLDVDTSSAEPWAEGLVGRGAVDRRVVARAPDDGPGHGRWPPQRVHLARPGRRRHASSAYPLSSIDRPSGPGWSAQVAPAVPEDGQQTAGRCCGTPGRRTCRSRGRARCTRPPVADPVRPAIGWSPITPVTPSGIRRSWVGRSRVLGSCG